MVSCPRYHSQHNHSARTKNSGVPSTFLNLLEARPIAVAHKKNAPLRRSRERHDQAPNKKSGRVAQSGGIRLARYTLRNHLPSFLFEIWSFSREARYTVTRITLFQFADTTSMSVPQFKDFSGARESASSPALTKINVPTAFAPRTHALYHFPPPRVNRRAPPKLGKSNLPLFLLIPRPRPAEPFGRYTKTGGTAKSLSRLKREGLLWA